MDCLKDDGKGIFFGFANEVLFEIKGKVLLFVVDVDGSFELVQFEFGSDPVR